MQLLIYNGEYWLDSVRVDQKLFRVGEHQFTIRA